jgi:hypothetical protein
MASTYLSRTQSASSTRTKCTLSAWIKRGKFNNSAYHFFVSSYISNSDRMGFYFNTGDTLDIYSPNFHVATNRVFRDPNAWLHVVYRIDTTHGNASDRIRIYVNGELQTSLGQTSYPTQNYNLEFGTSSHNMYIGNYDGSQHYFDGSMSHVHFLDGEDRDASYFGETDATTGEWKIKTNPTGINYGTNGFAILKDGNTITDQSSNSNNFTLGGGTLTKTEDCPSNVFATWNPLSAGSDMTFTFGNTGIRNDVATWNSGVSTLAMGTGKYYWEIYVHGGGDNNTGVTLSSAYGGNHSEVDAGRVVYSRNGAIYREGLSQGNGSTGVTYGDGDYIGVAFDTENGTLSFYKNGSAVSNSTTTDTSFLRTNNEYIVQCGLYNGGEFRFNFGNGAFGSTQLTGTTYQGAGSNGIFKYQPPTGFTALSTKGLNQ